MVEEWKTITEEGLSHYKVSNLGRVIREEHIADTHIVNRGRSMIVPAKRKELELKPQFEDKRPIVRLKRDDGSRCKKTLPLLVIQYFGEPCPGDISKYTVDYKDGDFHNNNIDNLIWVSRAIRASAIGKLTKGEPKDHFKKYLNLIIYYYDRVVAYSQNTTTLADDLNEMGFNTSPSSISRAMLKQNGEFYHIFTIKEVDDQVYQHITENHKVHNLKDMYDAVMLDRRNKGRTITETKTVVKEVPKVVTKTVTKTVVKEVPQKEKQEPKVAKAVNKPKVSQTVPKVVNNPQVTLPKKSVTSKLDDMDDKDFFIEQEKIKRERFKEELLRRMNQ